MKIIFKLLFFILSSYFCFNASGQISQSELDAAVNAGIDPYFIETSDTFSIRGPHSIVREILQDKIGNYWFTTWQGIMHYDGKVFTNYTLKYGLKHFHVFSSLEDSKGNLWFGTVRGGVYRYNATLPEGVGKGKSFTLFTTKDGLGDNTASDLLEDKEGNIWLCGGGATKYDGKNFVRFTTKDGLCSNDVESMLQDKTGKLWFGTKEGISCYDGKSFRTFKNKNGLPFDRVASLFEDKAGTIWIGTWKGLYKYDGKIVSDLIIPYLIMYMCQDNKGNLLLSHNKGAENLNFVLYSYDGKSFTRILEQTGDNYVIFGITEDRNGNIWYGTAKGVCRYNPSASLRSGENARNYFRE